MEQINSFEGLPYFGKVIHVNKFDFVDEVNGADPRTFVVTHLFEEYIRTCRHMNELLNVFAAKHRHVKILKILASEASQTMSHKFLPAFLVYQDKQLVKDSCLNIDRNLFDNEEFTLFDLEIFLSSYYGISLCGIETSRKESKEISEAIHSKENSFENPWTKYTVKSSNFKNHSSSRFSNCILNDNDDDW